ncbi:MAG: ATP-binding protein [Bacteroidales bacterium]|nr:ATP-binding protein [Bacteroidales bacterium]
MKLIERQDYLNRLIRLKGTPDIKIITGIRRCGKSKILQAFISYIQSTDAKANIIFIDFTLLEFEVLKEYHSLNDYIIKHKQVGKNNYLMIDEVQMCPNFETTINSLYASGEYDIYLTGSNAFLLSADLATLFTGRYIEMQVFPFSFREYCTYYNYDNPQECFDNYVTEGGLAGSYVYSDDKDKQEYIKQVFNTIITRDLTQKYNISDNLVLLHLSEYLMDNIGNISSPSNIANNLSANKFSTNHVSIGKYLKYLSQAFVFYKADRYDIRGKKYLESLNKYYLVDTGFRYALLGKRNMDWGRVYENIIYIELIRRGYDVYIGKLYQKEVDFVAMKGNEKFYIQVSDNISDDVTFEREVAPLLSIKDAYPKILIARTRHSETDYQGIKVIDIANWLINS